jgi:hypothetical protein
MNRTGNAHGRRAHAHGRRLPFAIYSRHPPCRVSRCMVGVYHESCMRMVGVYHESHMPMVDTHHAEFPAAWWVSTVDCEWWASTMNCTCHGRHRPCRVSSCMVGVYHESCLRMVGVYHSQPMVDTYHAEFSAAW